MPFRFWQKMLLKLCFHCKIFERIPRWISFGAEWNPLENLKPLLKRVSVYTIHVPRGMTIPPGFRVKSLSFRSCSAPTKLRHCLNSSGIFRSKNTFGAEWLAIQGGQTGWRGWILSIYTWCLDTIMSIFLHTNIRITLYIDLYNNQ